MVVQSVSRLWPEYYFYGSVRSGLMSRYIGILSWDIKEKL